MRDFYDVVNENQMLMLYWLSKEYSLAERIHKNVW